MDLELIIFVYDLYAQAWESVEFDLTHSFCYYIMIFFYYFYL